MKLANQHTRRRRHSLVWSTTFWALSLLASTTLLAQNTPKARVPGQVLLKIRGITAQQMALGDTLKGSFNVDALAKRNGVQLQFVKPLAMGYGLYEIRDVGESFKTLPSEQDTLELMLRLSADSDVERYADNRWYTAQRAPNDQHYGVMWHLDDIGAEAAWDISVGTSDQRVGVVDTGILRNHQDLVDKDAFGYDFVSCNPNFDNTACGNTNDGNGRDANYQDPGDECQPGSGNSYHGTHVSGTMVASTNNGIGTAGVNWNANLVSVRALGRCGGTTVDIMEGALWLAGYNINGVPSVAGDAVSVMNLSLGSPNTSCSQWEQDAIDVINAFGVLFVAAAGNDGGPVLAPATCTGVVSVAAHGPTGNLSGYSSFGPQIEVVAPGGDFNARGYYRFEDGIASTTGPNNNSYTYNNGTSMAAPHVAGAISVMQAVNPDLQFSELRQLFVDTGDACGSCQGVPTLRLDRILERFGVTPSPDPEPGAEPEPQPEPEPVVDDGFEENDNAEQAANIECGRAVSLYAMANDQDWFVVEANPGAQIEASINAANGVDLDLYIVEGGEVAVASESPTGQEAVSRTALSSGQFLVVNPFNDQQNGVAHEGEYTLIINCVDDDPSPAPNPEPTPSPTPSPEGEPDPQPGVGEPDAQPEPTPSPDDEPDAPPGPPILSGDDDAEPNDTLQQSFALECGEEAFFVSNDDDYYRVNVPDNSSFEASVVTGGSPLDMKVMAAADGTVLAEAEERQSSSTSSVTRTASLEALSAGDYVVWVSRPQGLAVSYTLRTTCEPAPEITTCSHARLDVVNDDTPVWGLCGLLVLAIASRRRRRRRR